MIIVLHHFCSILELFVLLVVYLLILWQRSRRQNSDSDEEKISAGISPGRPYVYVRAST